MQLNRVTTDQWELAEMMFFDLPEDKRIAGNILDVDMASGYYMAVVEREKRKAGLSDEEIYQTCYGLVDNHFLLTYIKNEFGLVGNYRVGNFLTKTLAKVFS